ncbi:restriction endonuclease subunit S [Vibrio campbellii]|uniref:restriction endonuclease subunit S n=1 Tax=Vibrio campbellii TaxID=680 RepID=UPI001F45902A|nr:restriction endonuclease subunit S [Vibrio campbellii]MCE7730913.1 restriction endonuclease subunit S [Vibrio campbellii]
MNFNRMLTIGDVAKVFDGPHATPKKIDTGPYFLSISSLENGKLDLSKSAHLSDEDFAKWTRRVTPEAGDILFSYETRLGEVAMMPAGVTACLGRRMGLLRPDRTKILPEYLLYAYQSNAFQEVIRAKTIHGATVDRIALKELPSFPIQVPPLKEQQKIVDILKGYDRKLVLNFETNQTIEEMAQAIFKSWFVDFDPVKAKMNGEQPEGMDAATASLFPEKLVESEMGLIPEGWDIVSIKDFGSVVCGKTPSKKNAEFYGGDVPFIKIPDTHGKVFITETTDTLTQAGDESQPKKRIPENSICVSCIATVGQVFITTKPSHTNQQINSVVPHDSNSLYYLLFKFKGLSKHFHDLASGGSATLNMNTRTFSNVELVRPTADVMEAFHQTIGGLMQKMLTNQLENATLAQLRDTLLPKLLSGEIELGSSEELVEAI